MRDRGSSYASPTAARTAVTAKLRTLAHGSPWPLGDLQRQYAYDQLVERLYRLDGGWVIKGATALLARRLSVRHTIDIDVYRSGPIAEVERQLREAAALDIGDWMQFEVGPAVKVQAAGAAAARVKVQSLIGAKVWAAFQVDVVADGIVMTGEPDQVAPLVGIDIGSEERRSWRAYPLVDHVADKVCAILERHQGRPSTRFKDLIDLVAIVQRSRISAAAQMRALVQEAHRRKLGLPQAFDVPDRQLWARGYSAEARRTVGLEARGLDEALSLARTFLNPLLDGTAEGEWDPGAHSWKPERLRE